MIKKIVLFVTISILTVGTTFGQFSFKYGGKIGGATTNLTGVGLKDFTPKPGIKLIFGGITNLSYGSRIALQVEAIYSGKGSGFSYSADNSIYKGKATVTEKLGYFAIPVMFQFKLGDRDNYFHFDLGVVSNILVYNKFKGTIVVTDDKGNESIQDMNIKETPNKHDLGYAFGFGLVANGLNFDFRYEVGQKQVFSSKAGNPSILNRAFQVSVGYTVRY